VLSTERTDLVCFSQLRWDFVYQRPNHLMSRAARSRRVWFVEEPVFEPGHARLDVEQRGRGLHIVRPVLTPGLDTADVDASVSRLLGDLADGERIQSPIAWYSTPMALPWSSRLTPALVIYDCMDELSAFDGAPLRMGELESRLLQSADLVFTGGHSLFEAKRGRHPNVHEFPSAVDVDHFGHARRPMPDVPDQRGMPRPRIGWFGVIDERMDLGLLAGIADRRPDWSFILVGPTVKIDPRSVPERPNIHLLGPRPYAELPRYIAGWDVAMMPFARNAATRFISPTKTPEYLAAGRPVVSTSIRDVAEPYRRLGLVHIADAPDDFVRAIEHARSEDAVARQAIADAFLAERSWDRTWAAMSELIQAALDARDRGETKAGDRAAADAYAGVA
jgi:UDP-galactopyranose mutase